MVDKIKKLAEWTFLLTLILTIICIAMLIAGGAEGALKWFLPFYLLIGAPTLAESFVNDFERLRSSYRALRGRPDNEL